VGSVVLLLLRFPIFVRQTLSRASYTLGATALRACCSLLVTKVLAAGYGTEGMVFLSQFLAITAFMHAIPFDSVLRVFVKQSAVLGQEERIHLLGMSASVNIALVLVASPVLYYYTSISNYSWYGQFALAAAFAGGMVLFVSFFTSITLWQMEMKAHLYALANGSSTVCGLVGVLVGVWLHVPLPWILVVWLVAQSLPLLATGRNFQEFKSIIKVIGLFWNERSKWMMLLKAGLAIATFTVIGRGADVLIRGLALRLLGEESTGLWQALGRISDIYFVPLNALLGMLFFPKAASLVNDTLALGRLTRQWLLAIMCIAIPSLLLLFLLRNSIIPIVMSEAFLPAASWMKYQLLGDGFKIMSFILTSLAIVQGKTKNLFYIELISATILLGGGYIAATYFGARGLVILHAIRYFIYCSYWIFVFRNMLFQNPNKST